MVRRQNLSRAAEPLATQYFYLHNPSRLLRGGIVGASEHCLLICQTRLQKRKQNSLKLSVSRRKLTPNWDAYNQLSNWCVVGSFNQLNAICRDKQRICPGSRLPHVGRKSCASLVFPRLRSCRREWERNRLSIVILNHISLSRHSRPPRLNCFRINYRGITISDLVQFCNVGSRFDVKLSNHLRKRIREEN